MDSLKFKEGLKKGKVFLGSWCLMPSPSVAEAMGYSGLDFLVVDVEHGSMGMEKAEDMVRACDVSSVTSIIRVPYNDAHLILKALDTGAGGVQVPHVSTAEEAKRVIEGAKYHPRGKRGLSPFTRAARYSRDEENHVASSNERTIVVLNIEGAEGLKNLKEIAKVPDVDVIFIGPYDLSQSLGKPGKVNDPDVVDSVKRSVKICKASGVACGSFARDLNYMELLIDCGIQYVTYSTDSSVILNSYRDVSKQFNKLVAGRKAKR